MCFDKYKFITKTSIFMRKEISKIVLSALSIVTMLMFMAGCVDENDGLSDGKAQIQFKLTDAPSLEYDKVVLDIQGVKVGVADEFYHDDNDPYYDENDDFDNVEWVTVNINNPGLYNLLDYRNGEMVALAGGEIPAGKISQVRLLLGPNSYVETKDGVSHPLKTPSAQTSGLKFNLHETLLADMAYSFVIDFDASRSVVATGNNKYILKPVIRTFAEAWGGSVKGIVLPQEANAFVQITNAAKDTLVALPEIDGKFLFFGVDPGSWKLEAIAADTTGYKDSTLENVLVETGVVNNLDTIKLVKMIQ